MLKTSYCTTCNKNLIMEYYGTPSLHTHDFVYRIAREHLKECPNHLVIVGYFLESFEAIIPVAPNQKGENNHGESERQQL